MTKLKPCPFCGSSDFQWEEGFHDDDNYFVFCLGCGVAAPEKETTDEVIETWNTRFETPDVQGEK